MVKAVAASAAAVDSSRTDSAVAEAMVPWPEPIWETPFSRTPISPKIYLIYPICFLGRELYLQEIENAPPSRRLVVVVVIPVELLAESHGSLRSEVLRETKTFDPQHWSAVVEPLEKVEVEIHGRHGYSNSGQSPPP